MKRETFINTLICTAFVGVLFCFAAQKTFGQTTTFTYQGRFTDSTAAQPTNGTYTMTFRLYDAATGGNQIPDSSTAVTSMVSVVNGIFTTQLDFGATAFPGADRYLEISVKKPSDSNYTQLTPRQPVTSTPYAIRSLSALNADTAANAATATNANQLGGVAASNFAQTNSTVFIRNQTAQQTADFNISGTGTANVFNAAQQFNLKGLRFLNANGSNNTFAGFNTGASNSSGFDNTFVGSGAGFNNTDGYDNSFFGVYAGYSNTGLGAGANSFFGFNAGFGNTGGYDNSFFGNNAGRSNTLGNNNTALGFRADVGSGTLRYATAIGSFATVSTSNTIALGRSDASDTVLAYGPVQINTLGSAGSTQLCYNGSNQISSCSSSLRYKTNIAPFASGLNFINQLRPISFAWKDGGMKDIGFGAEDVARINPLFVNYNQKGEVEGVKYDRFSVLFVNAFKEQQTQIEAQQKQINEQQKQIDEQKTLINEMKTLVCLQNPNAEICQRTKGENK